MSNDGILDQSEIERLLSGGLGGGMSAPTPPPAPVAAEDDGPLNQAELEALFAGLSGGGVAAAPVPPPPRPVAVPPMGTGPRPLGPPGPPSGAGTGKHIGSGHHAAPPTTSLVDEEGVPQGDLDYILKRAEDAITSVAATPMVLPTEVIEFQFPEFGGTIPSTDHATLDQISEVELDVKIELGRSNMYLEDVLKLKRGSVVPLDKMAGDTVDVYVNGRLLARGEVLVMNENFCVRIAELLAGAIPNE